MKLLDGIKILDLSTGLAPALATKYLAAFGAEVIKVEKPGAGDMTRKWEPLKDGRSLYFNYLNGGKKSVALDIASGVGNAIILELVKKIDVFVESFQPGYMETIGLSYEILQDINPDLIYVQYSTFGDNGPDKNRPGSSLVAQAKSVAMDMTGVIGQEPIKSEPSVGEHYASGNLAAGIMLALINRERHGGGQKLDVSLVDSLFNCIEAAPAAYSTVGEIHTRKGNFDPSCAPYDTFKTKDGFIAIGIATDAQWFKFCDALELKHLKEDSRFQTNEGRVDDYLNKLRPLVEKETMVYTKSEIEEKCRVEGIPCSAVFDISEIMSHPNTKANHFMCELESKQFGQMCVPNLPFELSRSTAEISCDGPELGANTEEVLDGLGYTADAIKEFVENQHC